MNKISDMELNRVTGYDLKIELNKNIFSYDDLGSGAVPIIFIHGFPFDKSCWSPQLEFLKDSNRVIAYDIRGYGKSVFDSSPASIDLFADDLIVFMDGLKIEKAIVCGLSMGGYILLNATLRFPERFEAIVLSDTQCIADSEEAVKNRHLAIDQIKEGKLVEFADKFISKVFCENSLKGKTDLVTKVRNIVLSTPETTIISGLTALAKRNETCTALPKIAVPALIICGEEDVITPLNQSSYLQSQIPKSKLVVVESAGHLSNLENSVRFNDYFYNFIRNFQQQEN